MQQLYSRRLRPLAWKEEESVRIDRYSPASLDARDRCSPISVGARDLWNPSTLGARDRCWVGLK
jgi:hypothetical protein